MNDEIKEILDKLQGTVLYGSLGLTERERIKLLDHITNLQEKVNQYENPDDMTLFYMWLDEKAKDKMKQLQEEYEKEHYLVDKLTRQLNDEYKNTEYQCKQKEDYKSRIDKAIEYINKQEDYFVNYPLIDRKHILNILNGGDEE